MTALTLAVATVQLLASRRKAEQRRATDIPVELRRPVPTSIPSDQLGDPPVAPVDRAPAASAERLLATAKRDALRAKIFAAQDGAGEGRSAPTQPKSADTPSRPGELKNRMGGHDELVAHLNHDFMPLAHECIQQAKERSPNLRGMLTLQVETVSDERLGALVERAEVPASSEVQARELAECIRENAMTLTFPPPIESGPSKFEFTLRIETPSFEKQP